MDVFKDDLIALAQSPLRHWLTHLPAQLDHWQREQQHGELRKWLRCVEQLPTLPAEQVQLTDTVTVRAEQVSDGQQQRIRGLLQQLTPWRKGPFDLHGVSIDTEWRSDYKWQRVAPHIGDLTGQQVLDVGCGSGYHLWRMLESGAAQVWGVDPGQLFLAQFLAVRHFMPAELQARAHWFPVGVEDLPELAAFDTVFSMGVLYHRRSPIDFLTQLHAQLRKGGQLVLETLVVEGDVTTVLVPGQTYAKMRNVWFIPSTQALLHWLERCGFSNVRVVDESMTDVSEQRATEWMTGQSLADFLDPEDPSKTIEGYPAPRRAVVIANV
ncbi:tRNA 5-methoxyuridine(34)/uridine 5-oxyacetic acid(34) synthase CmoB [Pseudidiomarina sp. 1APP75-32.1]|uniref:tRNA U34 carboxymethyltransferase n=1 Tax=Pseudidiomarina terrestris TaxID=2820060 RepID=A0AAW7R282_9GAMM|nr:MULTISPECIES: tRNA 5-methoxyuridine(34)/uridine 5-oxyacetic acid(34) synthase CmoB [unclassified Pseudidiomarina]MDN7124624.1 tRNA 5-methoxyuridine(34)/uridine 5-oxyacetic acid(34) synthase CmoB [Pseudidiomarina sp. 1APP75-32.1]MDN7129085.1 tRNA 5-methoxyuridine(34)/uridine 5-oxyacetic acid(34) synthase CmoB [Pseudidiomarina sp. 1APR75-15]